MLSMELIKGTKVYEEIKEEAKEEIKVAMVTKLMQRGMNSKEIAELLELDIEVVRKVVEGK